MQIVLSLTLNSNKTGQLIQPGNMQQCKMFILLTLNNKKLASYKI